MSIPTSALSDTDVDLRPVRVQTMADQATDRLRNAIQRGSLAPGAQLVERELADKLGMSRVPVREAIHRLAEEGLVKKTAHRGSIVYLPSQREIEEITSVRIMLEELVVERVLQRWTAEVDAELKRWWATCARLSHRAIAAAWLSWTRKFHAVTWRIADHIVLAEMIVSLRHRVTRLLFETIALMPDDELSGTIVSHERLIDVFKRGNVAAAKQEIGQHIIAAAKDRILVVYQRTFTA